MSAVLLEQGPLAVTGMRSRLGTVPGPVAGRVAGPAGRHLHVVPAPSERVTVSPVRLTRFGRLVRTAVLLGIAVAVAVSVLGMSAGAVGAGGSVTVQPGQTMSEIAHRELPDLPIREAVAQIQLMNGLSTSQVHAGQSLVIPDLP